MNIKPIAKLQTQNITYDLLSGVNILGRNPLTSSVILKHQSISNQQCEIIIDDFTKKMYITDLNSRHGTFLNGYKLQPNIKVILKNKDTLRFGKDQTIYKVELIPFTLNNQISISFHKEDSVNKHLTKSFSSIGESIISNDYKREYELINYKQNALMKYASDLQRQNDNLIQENKRLTDLVIKKEKEIKDIIFKEDNKENEQKIKEKENILNVLKNELLYTKEELQTLSQLKGIESKYIEESIALHKVIKEYKVIIETINYKWNDMLNENKKLKEEINYLQSLIERIKKSSIDLVNQNKEYIKKFLSNIKQSLNSFNKETGNYLLEQVKEVIHDKENALKENIVLSNKNEELEYLNHKLSHEIANLNTQLRKIKDVDNAQNVIKQLQDKIEMMNNCYSPERVNELENIITKLTIEKEFKTKIEQPKSFESNFNMNFLNNNINKNKEHSDKGIINIGTGLEDIQKLKDILNKEVSDPEMQSYINKHNDINNGYENVNKNLKEIQYISEQIDNVKI